MIHKALDLGDISANLNGRKISVQSQYIMTNKISTKSANPNCDKVWLIQKLYAGEVYVNC